MSDSVSNEVCTSIIESIKLGACGWNHVHWQGSFYPDDLPPDWRLSYYANEFSAVLLTENQWRGNLSQLEEWAFDVDDHFCFYLQSKTPLMLAEQDRLQDMLGGKLGGVVRVTGSVTGNVTGNDIQSEIDETGGVGVINMASQDMRSWREWLAQHGASLRVIFLKDELLSWQQMSDFNALLELMGL